MKRTMTKADIDSMVDKGAKVRKKIGGSPRVAQKAAPAPAPVEKPNKEIAALAQSVDKAATEMAASTKKTNEVILALQKKLIEKPTAPKPISYKFTINRDSYGYIETVDAVPGG